MPDAAAPSVEERIHDSRALFDLGVQHYQHGEMRDARAHFDRAIERLTTVPGGARADVRLADAYADLLNDIQEVETSSYQDGPGLSPAGETPTVELLDEVVPELSPEQAAKERQLAEKVAIHADLPIVLNDRVLAWMDIYQGTLRDRFQEGLTRSGRYLDMIRTIFREEGLPEDLAYIAHVESAYKPHAYSRARAKGLWQFIVGTGTRYGLRRDWWVDERSDPELATRAAAAYLKDLYAMFGDWYLAMAAYNAGEGKIQRVSARTGLNDFWSIATTSHLRLETKNYVPAILAAILISKNPAKFGFGLDKEEPVRYDRVPIGSATDLGVVAKLAGTTIDVLRDLNPSLTRLMTPPNYPDFELHLPVGSGERFSAAFKELPVTARIPWKSHTVRSGETLAAISRRYGVSVSQIRVANSLSPSDGLRSGMDLQIPTYIAPPSGGHGDLTLSASANRSKNGSSASVYKVRKGDTLASIARRYRVSVSTLRSWNRLRPNDVIHPGDRLIMSGGSSGSRNSRSSTRGSRLGGASAQRSASKADSTENGGRPTGSRIYRVRRGDTLYAIASRLSTTVDRIVRLNNLTLSQPLVPGTVLHIEH